MVQLGLFHSGRTFVDLRVGHYQLDCQLPGSTHPVVLTPVHATPPKGSAAKRKMIEDALASGTGALEALRQNRRALQLRFVTNAHPTVTFVEEFSVGLARVNVEIDDELLASVSASVIFSREIL